MKLKSDWNGTTAVLNIEEIEWVVKRHLKFPHPKDVRIEKYHVGEWVVKDVELLTGDDKLKPLPEGYGVVGTLYSGIKVIAPIDNMIDTVQKCKAVLIQKHQVEEYDKKTIDFS